MKTIYMPHLINRIPNNLKESIYKIINYLKINFNADCMIVGGAVRDMIMNREVKDVDMECYGIDEDNFHKAMQSLGADGVGKAFFVYKIGNIDIALPRIEKKISSGHRGFNVYIANSKKEASRRRDFTINALLYSPNSGYLYDYWGGIEDIDASILRAVDKDTFAEDSLRVLRAMQFSSRLGFRIDKDTCFLCRDIPLDDLSKGRIFNEFEKMFRGKYIHYGLYALESMNISKKLWGSSLKRDKFIACALDMVKYIDNSRIDLVRDSYFLAIYSRYSDIDIESILYAINAPNRYHRLLKDLPQIPNPINNSFVASLAYKAGVVLHPLSYHPVIRKKAEELNIWKQPFDIGITPKDLIKRGYYGKALGNELKRIREERLNKLDKV